RGWRSGRRGAGRRGRRQQRRRECAARCGRRRRRERSRGAARPDRAGERPRGLGRRDVSIDPRHPARGEATMKAWLWLIACAGCSIADRDYTGATIELQLTNNDFDTVQDDTSEPAFELGDTDVEYSIVVEVFTAEGELSTKSTIDSSHITSIA